VPQKSCERAYAKRIYELVLNCTTYELKNT